MILPKSLWRLLAGVAVLGLLPAYAVAQKAGTPPPPQIPTFTVKGRVVFDDTNRAARRAQIALIQLAESRGAEHSSATDRDGRFVIDNVPTGVYFAMVNLPGIISPLAFMGLNERGPAESYDLKAIREYCTEIVVDGSNVDVTVHARRGGAISGKITYSDGEPAIDAQVALVRRTGKKPTRILTGFTAAALMSLRTDDRGRYRIAGIPPGEYVVSAAETNTSPNSRRGRGDDFFGGMFSSDALLVTYYGGSNRFDDATKLEVTGGSEASDIDISLTDATPHMVSGSVIAKLDRVPLPGATLSIRMRDQGSWFGGDAQQLATDDQGTWVFEGVPDGTYVLSVEPPPNFPVAGADSSPEVTSDADGVPQRRNVPTRKFVRHEMEITVSGSDLVVDPIALAEGASIFGTVEMPGKPDMSNPYLIQITWRYEGETNEGNGMSTVSGGGDFVAEGLHAGKVYLNANVNSSYGLDSTSGNLYVKSITLNGVDLRQRPLTIAEGQTIRNVRIVIAENPAKGSIKLNNSEGKPLPAKRVAIIPVDEGRWLFSSEIAEGTTDTRGIFNFTTAPGEYLLIVAAANDLWPPTSQEIRQRAPAAMRIKLNSGDNPPVMVIVP